MVLIQSTILVVVYMDFLNYYFTPSLQPVNGICVEEQLIGEWQIKFEGTQHPDLYFTVIDKKIPGFEFLFDSVEGQGLC